METLRSKGVPAGPANDAARSVAEAVTGNADAKEPAGDGRTATLMRDSMDAIRLDFAEANQWVLYGMALALGIAYLCALRHPGTRVTGDAPVRTPGGEAPVTRGDGG